MGSGIARVSLQFPGEKGHFCSVKSSQYLPPTVITNKDVNEIGHALLIADGREVNLKVGPKSKPF